MPISCLELNGRVVDGGMYRSKEWPDTSTETVGDNEAMNRIASPYSLPYESGCLNLNATEKLGGSHMGGGISKMARRELVTTIRNR